MVVYNVKSFLLVLSKADGQGSSESGSNTVVISTGKNKAGIPGCQRDHILLSACPGPNHAFVRQTDARH